MKNLITITLTFISISLFSQDEKRLALVIGNANYEKGELKNPVNDARLVASTLDSLEFDVILKENLATKRDMTAAIREFGSKRSEYDVAFVYYAGHGIQVDDENFLLPTKEVFEEEFDVMDYGVSVQNIMRYLRAQTDEVNILILDACRDNPFESNWNATRSLKGGGLAKIPPPTGSLIAFSTDSGQTVPDGDGDNSIYSISLAKNMLLEDTSIDQVFRNVRAEVLAETNGNQRPVEATQLTGQTFYLNPTNISDELEYIQILINDEKYDHARSRIEPIVAQFPQNIRALEIRAEIFYFVSNYTRSIEEINSIIKINPNNARLHVLRGNNYVETNEYKKAEADFTKAIELDPENDENYLDRGKFYSLSLEDYDKAIVDFTRAIELDPLDPYNYYERGNAFEDNGQYNEALASYLKAEELDKDKSLPKSTYLYNNMAVVFGNLGQNDKAIEYYTKEIEISPDNFLGYKNRAHIYAQDLKDYEKAEADYTKAIELDPKNDNNYYHRGMFYVYDLMDYEKAIEDFTKAIELDPVDPYNYYERGYTFDNNGQYNEALASYLKAEELDKDKSFAKSESLYNNMAVVFENLGQNDKAVEYYTREIEISPDNFLGYKNRAHIYAKDLKDYEKAEADYTKAIELDPKNDDTYRIRGHFYGTYFEDYEKAIEDFTRAIELNSEDPYNHFFRAEAFRVNGQYNEALASYLKAEELDKDKSFAKSESLYNNMAVVFSDLGQNDKAIEYYTKAIEISPDEYLGYRNRAYRYAEDLKDYEKAEADYTKAIELDPENDDNYRLRGDFYRTYFEDYEKAIVDFTKAIELDPVNPYNYYYRGYTFDDNGQYNEALASYLKAEELDKDKSLDYLYTNIAIVFENLGQNDKAIEYYSKEIEISPKDSTVYNYLGNIYVQLREFDKAHEIYNKLIRVDDKNAQNYIIRARFFASDVDDYLSSISDLTKAIELETDNSDFYFTRAQSYFKIKDFKNAIYDFEKALELNPEITNSEYIYSEIAKCYVGIGDFDKALENYNMEINLGENALAYSERAIYYDLYLNDFEKANLDFEKAIELAPNTNNIILQYLNFLHSNKKYEQALKISKKAREIEPKDPQSDFVSALIYMETNKPFQTLKYLNSCIDKIIKYSGEGYWISDRSNSKVDLSEVFLMRGNFYEDKDKELMCSDYQEALNFTFDENQKSKINSLILENCGI